MVTTKNFGTLPDGRQVLAHSLDNGTGLRATVLDLGGIIQSLVVDTPEGSREVTLGMNSLDDYLAGHPYFGCITGRVAGRITHGRFSLDGQNFSLEINDPPNHLHGGTDALHKQLWSPTPTQTSDGAPALEMRHTSPHGACGYPGTLDITVTYSLPRPRTLAIEYRATTDRPAPLSLTNHAYFNLAGDGTGSVFDHSLQILAEHIVPADFDMTLTGRIQTVEGTRADLRRPRRLAEILPIMHRAHGDNYYWPGPKPAAPRHVATLISPLGDLRMSVHTTEKNLQFYTGRFLAAKPARDRRGGFYQPYDGLCLECQGYPDGVNSPDIEDIILRPGQVYYQRTEYRFG